MMVKEKEMIINCTPHDISIMKDGITTVIPKSGIIRIELIVYEAPVLIQRYRRL